MPITVALNYVQWDGGSHCGKQITIRYGGQTQTATIVDQCMSCGGYGGIDLTPGLANAFGIRDLGVVQATWSFGSGGDQQQTSQRPQQNDSPSSTSSSSRWTPSSTTSRWSTSSSTRTTSSSTSMRPTSTWSSSSFTTTSNSTSASSTMTSYNSTLTMDSSSASNSYVQTDIRSCSR